MPSLASPTQSMDTVYPEPMSRLRRRVVPKKRRGGSTRYRTQPVTFSEIQEVDEDNIEEAPASESVTSKSELSLLNERFEEFKRSRDQQFAILDNLDLNKNTVNNTSVRSSTTKLPSRPSF